MDFSFLTQFILPIKRNCLTADEIEVFSIVDEWGEYYRVWYFRQGKLLTFSTQTITSGSLSSNS